MKNFIILPENYNKFSYRINFFSDYDAGVVKFFHLQTEPIYLRAGIFGYKFFYHK